MQDILHPPRGSNPTVDFLLQSPQLPTYDHADNLADLIHHFCDTHHIPMHLVTVHSGPRPTLLFIKVHHYGWALTVHTTFITRQLYDFQHNPINYTFDPSDSKHHPHPQNLKFYVPLATLQAISHGLAQILPLQVQNIPIHTTKWIMRTNMAQLA